MGSSLFLDIVGQLPLLDALFIIVSNVSILFQDMIMFCGLENNHIKFGLSYLYFEQPLYKALFVPQAWSLSLELYFYLLAPFLVTQKKFCVLGLICALVVKVIIYMCGLSALDPWSYRFFPAELCFFLWGALFSYVSYPRNQQLENTVKYFLPTLLLILLFIKSTYTSNLIFITCMTLLLPLLMNKNGLVDNILGKLSYLTYISHLLVLDIYDFAFKNTHLSSKNLLGFIFYSLLVVIVALILMCLVEEPVNRYRKKLKLLQN